MDETRAAPTPAQIADAAKKAVEHPDVQTIFFVDFPPNNLNAKDTTQLKELVDMVQSWQAYSSCVCEGNLVQEINSKHLSADTDGQFGRSSYRAKVLDYLFRRSPWFVKTFDQNITKRIEVDKADFHSAILQTVLDGFHIPQTAYPQLEKVLTTIANNIETSSSKTQEKQQYWFMLTRYDWMPEIETAWIVNRAISLSINQQLSEYLAKKSTYTKVSIDLQFSRYDTKFETGVYEKVLRSVDPILVDGGMGLVTQKTTVVPI